MYYGCQTPNISELLDHRHYYLLFFVHAGPGFVSVSGTTVQGINEQISKRSLVKWLQIISLCTCFSIVLLKFPFQWQNNQVGGQLKRMKDLFGLGFQRFQSIPFRPETRHNIMEVRPVCRGKWLTLC